MVTLILDGMQPQRGCKRLTKKRFCFFVSPALVKVPVSMFLGNIAEPLFVSKTNSDNFIIFRNDASGEIVVDITN
jgi:hypothetical protein